MRILPRTFNDDKYVERANSGNVSMWELHGKDMTMNNADDLHFWSSATGIPREHDGVYNTI